MGAEEPQRTWRLVGITAIAPMAWGTTYLVTTELLPPDRPLLSGVLRALPAGLLLLLFTRTLPHGRWWWRAAVLGTLNIGAFFALLFVAAYLLPGGVAATLTAAQPLLVAALALPLLAERPTRWRLVWGVAGVAGVGLMVLRGTISLDPMGVAAGLAGTAAMATGIVLIRRWGRPVGVLTFTGWQLTAGGLLLAPVALGVEGPPPMLDAAAIAGYAWLGLVGTMLAYPLWFQGLARLPVAPVSFLPLLSPVVATALGWWVLDESLSAWQAGGFTLALAAIAAAQFHPAQLSLRRSPHPSSRRRWLERRSPRNRGHGAASLTERNPQCASPSSEPLARSAAVPSPRRSPVDTRSRQRSGT